ncbi:uncharacterized protein LOC113557478 isoform X1 [Rhopalosiphum maidis]|uniref:uncharacterized protein LOC113557478 isoform X1 n=2 Tax=Rhopalosiphum maidis TaxID=43146 RepID=UPI000F0052ED|nr:uncharacterized protein LOC113557478 isoform X1 [Rhopalosiphum maidis]
MEQIVKIFVHQSYFIENDLIVDYNVEQEALINVSPKDWIALIPKGWSGVDEQVAYKTIDSDCDVANLAIKSVIMEKKCFQDVVECEKHYQLMYISQYLEILGRSEYFTFLHQSGPCNCISSSVQNENKDNFKQSRLSSFSRNKPLRRQSPTPRAFYKNRPQSQNNVVKSEKLKSKPWSTNKCINCNAPNNFSALESAYLAKIQDLTTNNEAMEQRLLTFEKDLVHTLEVVNKQFKLSTAISQQKRDIQKFIDDLVDGLVNDGKITFWAHDQEFSVVREFPEKNQISPLPDDCTLSINKSLNSSKEVYMKAIIGQQEETIQHLVDKIKDLFDLFLKVNSQTNEQNNSDLTSSESKINNIGYMDSSGTTYFSPPSYITDTLNDINLYLANTVNYDHRIEKIGINENVCNWTKNTFSGSDFPVTLESSVIPTLNNEVKDKILTFEDWKQEKNEFTLCTQSPENSINEKTNPLNIKQ